MPKRMLRYYVDIKFLFDSYPIYQYVVYIGKQKLTMKDKIEDKNLKFWYNLIDMHKIDCEELLKIDTPDALVLAILCDFKDKDEVEVLGYILKRLLELSQNDSYSLSKYMLILETLSQNRDLQDKLKEASDMLKNIDLEKLPFQELAFERGIERGIEKGIERGIEKGIERGIEKGIEEGRLDTAIVMYKDFDTNLEDISKKLNIPIEILKKRLER